MNGFGQTVSSIQVTTFVSRRLTLLLTGTLRTPRTPPRLPLVERLRDAGRLVESVIPAQEEALSSSRFSASDTSTGSSGSPNSHGALIASLVSSVPLKTQQRTILRGVYKLIRTTSLRNFNSTQMAASLSKRPTGWVVQRPRKLCASDVLSKVHQYSAGIVWP